MTRWIPTALVSCSLLLGCSTSAPPEPESTAAGTSSPTEAEAGAAKGHTLPPETDESSTPLAEDESTAGPRQISSMPRKEMLNLAATGVVVVTALDAMDDTVGFGSGCIVGNNLILTNHHVVANAVKARVQTRRQNGDAAGTDLAVTGYVAVDSQNDLILLEVSNLPASLYAFSVSQEDRLEQHDQIFSMGHPNGLKFSTSPGFVNALLTTRDMPLPLQQALSGTDTSWIQTDAVIAGGSSGGPVLDESGSLVGINTLALSDSRIAFAVAANHIRDIMGSRSKTRALPLPDADVITTKTLAEVRTGFDREYQQLFVDIQSAQASGNANRLQEVIRRNNPVPACVRRCCEIADQYRGKPEAADALKVAADVIRIGDSLPAKGRRDLDRLLNQVTSESGSPEVPLRVINALFGVSYSQSLDDFLRTVIGGESANSLKAAAGIVLISAMANSGDAAFRTEMQELASDINSRFGHESFQSTPVSEILQPVIDAGKLEIGKVAPEIVGTDVAGKTFRLSDYRGKVVVLDFWADWCPHCRNMYPEERALVEKLQNEPFVLLGVNGDEPGRVRSVINSGAVTWRSWLDGPAGPIAEKYDIQAWPTIYVLDQQGRIRATDVRGEALEAAVESLLHKSERFQPSNVVSADTAWQFLSVRNENSLDGWQQVEFDDSSWQSGPGPFAFSNQLDSGTALPDATAGQRPLVTLFRTEFTLSSGDLEGLLMHFRYNDGICVTVNGNEVYRGNVSSDGGMSDPALVRGSEREAEGTFISLDSSVVRPGKNSVAVSLHQHSVFSARPLFSMTIGKVAIPAIAEIDKLTLGQKTDLCRLISSSVDPLINAEPAVERLQDDDSASIRIQAARAAAIRGYEVTRLSLKDPTHHQELFDAVTGLNSESWRIVSQTGLTQQNYLRALEMAKAAYKLRSDVHPQLRGGTQGIANTLGMAFFRNADYESSLKYVNESVQTVGSNPVDEGLKCLALNRLKRTDEALQSRKVFHRLVKSGGWESSELTDWIAAEIARSSAN